MQETLLITDLEIKKATLKVLHYYSLFKYPVNLFEIHGSCSIKCSQTEVKNALAHLESIGKVFSYNNYYSILPYVEQHVYLRIEANNLAVKKIKKARFCGNIIYQFPFVRFVGISGSLSKGYASNRSDFDFFIVTEKNRLWICRTILHLFKKLTFLFGLQHSFCMNYFIDTVNMNIEEKNIFTAIELSSLTIVHGVKEYTQIQKDNNWVNTFLPNDYVRFNKPCAITDKNSMIKKLTEFILNTRFANKLNEKLMHITDNRWRKKWTKRNYPMADYPLAFKTTMHISKNHAANHQKKVLDKLKEVGFGD